MELLEVKSNIARILYNPADNHLLPSDFLLIEDDNQKLIAQIVNIETTDASNNTADVRLILSIDKDDNLSYYNGYIPLKTSSVIYINPDEIVELIKSNDENIYIGNLSNHNECFVKVPLSCIDDRIYIQSDRYDKVKTLIQNITAELISKQKKVIIFDFDGQYSLSNNTPRLKIADSFKLPLNFEAFNNIIEYDMEDCSIEAKAVIQSIVLELREYLKTVDNKFLPFTLFKTVIDNEYSSNPLSGLIMLRNKLWLYEQEGIFAESKTQFEIINNILNNQNVLIIDASALEEKWYKFAIQTIQNLVQQKVYFVLSLNDIDADKKTITGLYNNPNVIPIVSTSYDSKYRQILKSICKNQILFRPSKQNINEEDYSCYINRINSWEFIIYGESELYIPLIVELESFNASTPEEVTQNEIKKDVDRLFTSKKLIPTDAEITVKPQDEILDKKEQQQEEVVENTIETDETTEDIQAVEQQNTEIDDDFNDDDLDFLDEQNNEQITIDDIRKKQTVLQTEEKEYDIFSPVQNTVEQENIENNKTKDTTSTTNDEDDHKYTLPMGVGTSQQQYEETYIDTEISSNDINIDESSIEDIFKDSEEEKKQDFEKVGIINDMSEYDEGTEAIVDYDDNSSEITDVDEGIITIEGEKDLVDISQEDLIEEITDIDEDNAESEDLEIIDSVQDNKLEEEQNVLEVIDNIQDENEIEHNSEDKVISDEESEITEIEEIQDNDETIDKNSEIIPEDKIINNTEGEIQASENENTNNETSLAEKDDKEEEISPIDDIINDIEEKATNGELKSIKEEANDTEVVDENNSISEKEEEKPSAPPVKEDIKEKESPKLPHYEADVSSETMEEQIPFKIGDKVYHPRHGYGVIVGFAQYSNKILFCRIEFKNEGVRILDPRVGLQLA